ncbi:MAG: hypothetical protein WCC60_22625 [Ilumatobacteraceae bacterium]
MTGTASASTDLANGGTKTVTAACPVGKKVVGGGGLLSFTTANESGEVNIISSYPTSDTVWTVTAAVDNTQDVTTWTVTAFAVCL